jgi:hypothetical protein
MSVLREGDSINFQKGANQGTSIAQAFILVWNSQLFCGRNSLTQYPCPFSMHLASCTLDGCVKVYTSRVDSVATETTKLLGGLATSASKFEFSGFNGQPLVWCFWDNIFRLADPRICRFFY